LPGDKSASKSKSERASVYPASLKPSTCESQLRMDPTTTLIVPCYRFIARVVAPFVRTEDSELFEPN
jgi:hypothetical protein